MTRPKKYKAATIQVHIRLQPELVAKIDAKAKRLSEKNNLLITRTDLVMKMILDGLKE